MGEFVVSGSGDCERCGASFPRKRGGQPRRYCYACSPPVVLGIVRHCDRCGVKIKSGQVLRGHTQRCPSCRARVAVVRRKKVSNPIYNTPAWKLARHQTLVRDGFRCQIRLPGCRGEANCADHIVELEEGGAPLDLRNLQAACIPCNTAKRNIRKGREKHAVRAW